ncbi:hypothetical protein [Glycomyces buryatensis]|uniref:Uncharacterized protein n=1 Tax=Glycomyces buryatensis TaxID=2570927 RepID=A0A4S8QF12_9ACTN|nr:hypothetical protein [Glycomyces buryatensis]THV42998.1 hypothetical protein FAB82_03325 [Glycomyces buryatensis]
MDEIADQTLTDDDEHVTLRLADDGGVTIEVAPTGFRLSPKELARLIVETADHLPNPTAEGRDAIASAADSIADFQQTLASGGFEAFNAAMRRRLGIAEPDTPPIRSGEHDKALAAMLGSTVDSMRQSQSATPEPDQVLEAVAWSDEGDLGIVTSSERVIANLQIDAAARQRGVEGLGQALTSLLKQARSDLRKQSDESLRADLPEGVAETMDQAPAEGERAGRLGQSMLDDIVQKTESLKRKAGH